MAMSVNTNQGAMIALQNLNKTTMELNQVQNRINTGMKVSGPKDNGAIFAIAQNMRSEVAGLGSVKTALENAISTVDVAVSAGKSVSDLLVQMKEKAVLAKDSGLDASARTALDSDFTALRDQITKIVDNASFNGTNMIALAGTDVVTIYLVLAAGYAYFQFVKPNAS